MSEIVIFIMSNIIFFALGWIIGKSIQGHTFKTQLEYSNVKFKLDKRIIAPDKLLVTNKFNPQEKGKNINQALLENDRAVVIIVNELKNMQEFFAKALPDNLIKEKLQQTNVQVNAQLANITQLLADVLGKVAGNRVEDIHVQDDLSKLKIIDVRSQDEFIGELGHIVNSQLICLQDNFEKQLLQLNKSESYVFVCRSGKRSARAGRIALGHGFRKIYNMQGGMLEYCRVHGKPR